MLPVANLILMRKTGIVSLTLMLAVSLSISGCGVHLDDGSGDTVIASKVQMARYRASACQEAIQAGIEQVFQGSPNLLEFKNRFANRSKALGSRWPSTSVKLKGKAKTENLPEPLPFRTPANAQALLQKMVDCQADTLNDGIILSALVARSQDSTQGDKDEEKRLRDTATLAKVLISAGIGMGRDNKQIAATAAQTLPTARPSELSPLRYINGKWSTDKSSPEDKGSEKGTKQPLTQAQKVELERIIGQLDSLRFNLEKNVAQGGEIQLKRLVSNAITPLLRRELQELVSQLGSDPRQAAYQPYPDLSGADKKAISHGLTLAQQLQIDLVSITPNLQDLGLIQTLSSLSDLQEQLGFDSGALPGLKDVSATVSSSVSVK